MSLLDRIKKNSTVSLTASLSDSQVLLGGFEAATDIPALNIALSGSIKGGFGAGITIFAGESRRFKSMFCLTMAAAYMNKYPESICIFYDSEFGSPISYFANAGIDTERVVHVPIQNIEELKHDVMNQLNGLERGEKVIILVDSIGNLASVKEIEDTIDGKQVADMTRAKSMKSMFRQITPILTIKDIPMLLVNHTYKQIGTMYPAEVMGGGTGAIYAPNAVFFIGKRQEKDGTELVGNSFVINVEKSRKVIEKSKFPIVVSFEHGIDKWSTLLDIATEVGIVIKPSQGWYSRVLDGEIEERKWRRKDTESNEFWDVLLDNPDFDAAIIKKYRI